MQTQSRMTVGDARDLSSLADGAVALVVTSPPYPMIEMWDACFRAQSPEAAAALDREDGAAAFEAMHRELDRVWAEVFRVLMPGGLACINVGDATRTIAGDFRLYPNHARILTGCMDAGLTALPDVLWRKQTNAPNKFMGSGMLPAGAYVTLEHEYVLVLRKGGKRAFTAAEKQVRRESAYFWEERNTWFSDVWWDVKGSRQELLGGADLRKRSGAFPFELAWRLVCMFSMRGDLVLDPFAGTGTTLAAATALCRNFAGFEIDPGVARLADEVAAHVPGLARDAVAARIARHRDFVRQRLDAGKEFKHESARYGFPVITAQERGILFTVPARVRKTGPGVFAVEHEPAPYQAPAFSN